MIHFAHPEAFLLLLLAVAVTRRRFVSTSFATGLRAALWIVLAALLADPDAASTDSGRDLVVAVDRSRSVPETAQATAEEWLDRSAKEARDGDRVGVVAFGRDAAVESPPRGGYVRAPLAKPVDRDGTDLAEAIDAALAAIPPGRPASILLVTDGEATGDEPERAARRAQRRGVRVDAVPLRRIGTFDVAVEDLTLPPEVTPGEPFQVAAWVHADRPVTAKVRLLVDGKPVAEGERTLRAGTERLLFRDVGDEPGVHEVAVEVVGVGDRVPENDRARAALRVAGRFRVLCVTPAGRSDRLTESLRAAGLEVVPAAPAKAPLSADGLDGFRALVLEDVPAEDLPAGALASIGRWVTDSGGGLLMTGGRASFGPGGYHHSAVEEVLPVSLEIREEQRKFALAMAIVLDRSGSMAISVGGGLAKMDLANRGACAAIDLLTSLDSVSIVAVDSEPHLVVPMGPVRDRGTIKSRTLSIESMGGGIFVSTGLHAGASELAKATQGTRHLVLFADANDAEEPGDYDTFVPAMRKAGVTVSVIGLGTERDSDAAFLKDVAAKGGGRVFFVENASDLPRVFAQETIQVARSALVEEPTAVVSLPDLAGLGALRSVEFPTVGGYSIAYLKPGAMSGLRTKDETAAPLLAFHQSGLGRTAAFLGIADGPLSGGLATWDGYGEFFSTLARWIAGTEAADDVHATVVRRGHEGRLAVEVARGREDLLARIEARVSGPDGDARPVDLVRTAATRLEGRFALSKEGVHRPVLALGDGRFLRVAPVALPYSPEFEPRLDPGEGESLLRRIAAITGGRLDPPSGTLFEGPREHVARRSLAFPLAIAALVLFLLEILVRRTSWSPRVEGLRAPLVWLRARAASAFRRPARPSTAPAASPTAGDGPRREPDRGDAPTAPVPAAPKTAPGIASVLDRLKKPR